MFGHVPAAAQYLQRGPLYSVHLSILSELNLYLQRRVEADFAYTSMLTKPLYSVHLSILY